MININDEKYAEKEFKPVFNNGLAGVVDNVKVRIEKAEDKPDNKLKYKMYFTDENGGEINKAFFKGMDEASEKQQTFFVRELKHYLNEANVKFDKTCETYEQLLDEVMKVLHKEIPKHTYSVAVCYGTKEYPKRFLEIDGFWGLRNMKSEIKPTLSAKALKDRPVADNESNLEVTGNTDNSASLGGDDLPFSNDDPAEW